MASLQYKKPNMRKTALNRTNVYLTNATREPALLFAEALTQCHCFPQTPGTFYRSFSMRKIIMVDVTRRRLLQGLSLLPLPHAIPGLLLCGRRKHFDNFLAFRHGHIWMPNIYQ